MVYILGIAGNTCSILGRGIDGAGSLQVLDGGTVDVPERSAILLHGGIVEDKRVSATVKGTAKVLAVAHAYHGIDRNVRNQFEVLTAVSVSRFYLFGQIVPVARRQNEIGILLCTASIERVHYNCSRDHLAPGGKLPVAAQSSQQLVFGHTAGVPTLGLAKGLGIVAVFENQVLGVVIAGQCLAMARGRDAYSGRSEKAIDQDQFTVFITHQTAAIVTVVTTARFEYTIKEAVRNGCNGPAASVGNDSAVGGISVPGAEFFQFHTHPAVADGHGGILLHLTHQTGIVFLIGLNKAFDVQILDDGAIPQKTEGGPIII